MSLRLVTDQTTPMRRQVCVDVFLVFVAVVVFAGNKIIFFTKGPISCLVHSSFIILKRSHSVIIA